MLNQNRKGKLSTATPLFFIYCCSALIKMGRYILHYEVASLYNHEPSEIDDYEYFSDKEDMHKRVNELADKYEERFSVNLAGYLQKEYRYNAVEIVKKYEPEEL